MAVEITPLGQKKPDGASELVKYGAKIIADNAQNVQDLIAADRGRLGAIEAKNTTQDNRLTSVETKNTTQDGTLATHAARLANLDNAAGFTGDPLDLNDAAFAETLANGTATQAALEDRLDIQVPPIVASAIASDPTVANSAATMAQSTAGLVPAWKASTAYASGQRVISPGGDIVSAKTSFTTGASYNATNWTASTQDGRIGAAETNATAAFKNLSAPANGTDINTILTTGHYPITSSTAANTMLNLPVLYPGTLEVYAPSSAVGYQRYTTFGDITNNPLSGVWMRLRQTSTTWNRWWKVGETYLNGNLPATSTNLINLDTFKSPGVFTVNNSLVVSYTTGLPVQTPGIFENLISYGAALSMQRFTAYGTNPATYWRVSSNISGGWNPWKKVAEDTGVPPAAVVDSGPYQHLIRDNDMRRRRFNRVTAPGVAVLIFDHGLTKFKASIWPLLQARNIPVTLALNPGQMTDANNNGATYADVQSWAGTGLVEPANHSYNHVGGTAYDTEIRASRAELETQIGQTIDTWVHPGNTFGDFTITADPNLYWNTEAGRQILANHGAVTGILASGTLPIGMNTIGAGGVWIDNNASTTGVQTTISNAITKQGMQIVRFHPQYLNDTGKLTTAELTTFLDWIKARVDAGELKVLTFRDAMSATR